MLYTEMMLPLSIAQQHNPHAHHLHDLAAETRAERRTRRASRLRQWITPLRAGIARAGLPADTPAPGT
jgi:hypothetical protein